MKTKDISNEKKKLVKELATLISEYPIVGIVDMERLPTPQLQKMREQLRGKVIIKMTKKRLMKLALKEAEPTKKNIEKLNEYFKGMPALIFTKDNPFLLYKNLGKNKSKAPAKTGQIAPFDIKVTAGKTSFSPGPIISQLASIGLKTAIENGKIAIKEDAVVVKEGEMVSANVAEMLARLKVEPMEIGLILSAVYEKGDIFTRDVLHIDEEEYFNNFKNASKMAFNLAFNSGYPTTDTIELMIIKAYNDSKALAISEDIITDETVALMIEKAERSMMSLKNTTKYDDKLQVKEEPKVEEVKEEKVEEVKEELKVEEKKEEVKEKPKKKEEKPKKEKEEPKVEEVKEEKVEEVKEEKIEPKKKEKKMEEIKKEAKDVDVSQKKTTQEDIKKAEELLEQIQKNALKK